MSMVSPAITDIETLDTPEESKQFLTFFWCLLELQYIILYAICQ